MLKHAIRGLPILILATASLCSAPRAEAVVRVAACGDLTKARETYLVTQDLTSDGVCFLVKAEGITIDLGGHTLSGGPHNDQDGRAVSDGNIARPSLTVKNGRVEGFTFGIYLLVSPRATLRNLIVVDNKFTGIVVGPNALVKDCTVQRNGNDGINIGDSGQLQNCLIGSDSASGGDDSDGNGRFGVVGGEKVLITGNTIGHNGQTGILVGNGSTVSHNTSNDNGEHGIAVGQKSLVTFNTANDNTQKGIEVVVCPATVTNNEASGNAINFYFNNIGAGACVTNNNTSP